MTLGDGERRKQPPIGFLEAYRYQAVEFAENGMTGRVDVEGTRFVVPFDDATGPGTSRWVNLEIPNDPWPPTIKVGIEWTCRPPL